MSIKECVDISDKLYKLTESYKSLADKISKYSKAKAKNGIDCSTRTKNFNNNHENYEGYYELYEKG